MQRLSNLKVSLINILAPHEHLIGRKNIRDKNYRAIGTAYANRDLKNKIEIKKFGLPGIKLSYGTRDTL